MASIPLASREKTVKLKSAQCDSVAVEACHPELTVHKQRCPHRPSLWSLHQKSPKGSNQIPQSGRWSLRSTWAILEILVKKMLVCVFVEEIRANLFMNVKISSREYLLGS